MASKWRVHQWKNSWNETKKDTGAPLVAEALMHHEQPASNIPPVRGMIFYADTSYLACRVLMISSQAVHPEALYCAAQTMEKYMKAILLDRLGLDQYRRETVPGTQDQKLGYTHDLTTLANALLNLCKLKEFVDKEFLRLCKLLTPFEVAGRYPDHHLSGWVYSLDVLTFLDGFIVHCRQMISVSSVIVNMIKLFSEPQPNDNPVMVSARVALRDNNHDLDDLINWPR